MIKDGLFEKMTFQIHRNKKKRIRYRFWRKHNAGREKYKLEGTEAGRHLVLDQKKPFWPQTQEHG